MKSKFAAMSVLLATLAVGTVQAQDTGGTGATSSSGSTTGGMTSGSGLTGGSSARIDDDEGFDMGWLGLIGLAGLAGLMPKNRHDHVDVSRNTTR